MLFYIMENKWKVKDNLLVKEFEFKDFKKAIEFVNYVAEIAEQENHHPDILIYSYKKVKISLFTHSENKITDKDYYLAEKIDKI
jgi:4a-hydroxytetrahydrobiopterin dehydratase